MKIVRILVYEGSASTLKLQMAETFIGPDRPFSRPEGARNRLTICEVFRGSMGDDVEKELGDGIYKREISAEETNKDIIGRGNADDGLL